MGRQMSYVPMGPRPKIASEAEVQAMLAKMKARNGPPVANNSVQALAVVESPAKPPEEAPLLTWEQPVRNEDGTGYCRSSDQRYSVCKVRIKGVVTYELWSLLPCWHAQVAVGKASFEECRLLAEECARKDPMRAKA